MEKNEWIRKNYDNTMMCMNNFLITMSNISVNVSGKRRIVLVKKGIKRRIELKRK